MSANAMFKMSCIDFVSKYHYINTYAWEIYIEIFKIPRIISIRKLFLVINIYIAIIGNHCVQFCLFMYIIGDNGGLFISDIVCRLEL